MEKINKNILIAADESENARRAVLYVGEMLGGLKGFKITILHVIREPEEDYFPHPDEKGDWLHGYKNKTEMMLDEYRQILIRYGFSPDDVSVRSTIRYCPSMAECILAEKDQFEYSTIVVGRQCPSRKEEFLFGSISGKIVTHARNCTVWVVG